MNNNGSVIFPISRKSPSSAPRGMMIHSLQGKKQTVIYIGFSKKVFIMPMRNAFIKYDADTRLSLSPSVYKDAYLLYFFFLTKVVQFLLTPCKSTAVVAVVKLDHNWISMDIQFMIGLIYFTFVLMSAVLADTLQFKKIQVIKNWLDRLMQHQYTWRVQRAEAGKAPVHHGTKYQNFADTKKYTGRDICHFLNHHPVCAGLQRARVEARAAMRGCTSLPAQWS